MDPDGMRWKTYDGGRVPLRASEVHLWRIDLEQERSNLEAMESNLNTGEVERSRRFRYENDREQFVLSHGILREVLGIYLQVEPKKVPIASDSRGKPEIRRGGKKAKLWLRFNLSHSQGMVLIAIAMDRDLGVDVEYADPDFPVLEVARRFFTGQEAEFVASSKGLERSKAFFSIWTRREAYQKATGEGLGSHGAGVPFFGVGASTRIHNFKNDREWTCFDIKLDGNYFAALVAEGRDLGLRLFKWRLVRPR